MATSIETTRHGIHLEFMNAFGQHVFVIDCPFKDTTVVAIDSEYCTCGIRI